MKRARAAARKVKEKEPGIRALLVYLLTAITATCMVRATWVGGDPGICCDKLTMTGTAHAAPEQPPKETP